jgi:HD superfamily phosphohydrolase
MSEYALVDGAAVPSDLTVPQLQVLFPRGVVGLTDATGRPVLPGRDGSIVLEAGKHYTIPSAEKPASPVLASPKPNRPVRRAAQLALPVPTFDEYSNGFDAAEAEGRRIAELAAKHQQGGKMILDRIHEHITLPALVCDVMDTPEFQRLRTLKQLGMVVYLYPGATHTRFEHSLGVAHLAGLLTTTLQARQPELGITEKDVGCVAVAGLCHDLGHGPFSHLFEEIMNRVCKQADLGHKGWHHEQMSSQMVRRIFARVDLGMHGMTEDDVNFIVTAIDGLPDDAPWPDNIGRPESKRFLLDIVSNKRNGIDVDKLDYFLRDSQCIYGRATVDCHIPRLFKSCRVIAVEGKTQICFEEKMAMSLGDIFMLRAKLHKYAYQHRVPCLLNQMMSDALLAAAPHFTVQGSGGKAVTMMECMHDMDGFCRLGDWIVQAIQASREPSLAEAQRILQRIDRRELYSMVGSAQLTSATAKLSAAAIEREVLQLVAPGDREAATQDLVVQVVVISFGSKDASGAADDPIDHVNFYNPRASRDHAYTLSAARQSPLFAPSQFAEKTVTVMCRNAASRSVIMAAFSKWRDRHVGMLSTPIPIFNSPAVGDRKRERSLQ